MRHLIYYTHLLLFSLLFPLLPVLSVHAQPEEEVRCSIEFTAQERKYDTNELRVTWIVDGAPAGYDVVALQITQNGETVREVDSGRDWRLYSMDDGEAFMDVTNLVAGKVKLDAMLLNGTGSPCRDADKGIWLAKTDDDFEWKPPVVSYKVANFRTEHEKGIVSFNIDVKEPEYNVNYFASITLDGNDIGGTKIEVINEYPERVEIALPDIDFKKVTEAIPVKLYVEAWYTDNLKTPQPVEMEAKILPPPKFGLLEKIGKVVMKVLNSQAAVAGIMLALGSVLMVKIYSGDNKAAPKFEYGRPPKNAVINQQLRTNSQATKSPSFSARIRQSTTSRHENVIAIEEFPCAFGRNKNLENGQTEKNNGKLFINILHDAKISREHFEIRKRDNEFYLASRSNNGIKVNQTLVAKGEQVPLSLLSLTAIEIGEQTKIELQPV